MDATEREVYYYLKARPRQGVTVREISRRIGGKRKFHASPDWARALLTEMVARGILESDDHDHFRLKPRPAESTQGKRWASPAIAKLLKQSGKDFGKLMTTDEEDEYYDKL